MRRQVSVEHSLGQNRRQKQNSAEHFLSNMMPGGMNFFCRRPDAEWVTKRIFRACSSGKRRHTVIHAIIAWRTDKKRAEEVFQRLHPDVRLKQLSADRVQSGCSAFRMCEPQPNQLAMRSQHEVSERMERK